MNVESLKTLHAVSYIFGITPTMSNQHKTNDNRLGDYCRGCFYIILFVVFIALEYYTKVYIFSKIHPTVLWTYTLCDLTVTIINILGICSINIRHGNKVKLFIKTLQELEVFIVKKERILAENRKYKRVFYLRSIALISFILLGAILINCSIGLETYKWMFLKDIQNYQVFVLSYLMTEHCGMIGKRMKDLNKHLMNILGPDDAPNKTNKVIINIETKNAFDLTARQKFDVNTISRSFTTICEVIGWYNDIYGSLFVVYSCNIVTNILVPLNMALLYWQDIQVYENHTFGYEIIIFCIIWLLFPLFCGLRLFTTCGKVEKEVENVPKICYSLMKHLGDEEDRFKMLKSELKEYASQVEQMKPKFSAVGLFDVNYKLVLPVLGTAATYIIVLLQFHTLKV